MRTELDYITINGEQVFRPPTFSPRKEDIYKGDYRTCTGKIIADRVGWKFSDMELSWKALPQNMVDILVNMTGINTLLFDDLDGELRTEQIVRTSMVAMRHRHTQGGVPIWMDVKVSIQFIEAHN